MTTRELVAALLDEGLTGGQIARKLGISKPTVAYHRRRLGRPGAGPAPRYDWTEVQRFHDEGNGVRACMRHFGFASSTWTDAVRRGDLLPRPQAMPLEALLAGRRHRGHVKRRLIRLGLKQERCEICGISDWLGKPLSLALHHVNGDGDDNRLENLELLCPNCHSQTDNFAGRSLRRAG
ncbi:MAG TPA: helix-turn-helix domain-containing protein [Candidatus Limnocylindria bacterium]|nr:helix-turn-helix domain-containing protein [Candidatus Limnocylindria bacterium]